MDINIKGNPGTGNTFQEIHIEHVENYNPNATTVTNNYYSTRERKQGQAGTSTDHIDTATISKAILDYVGKLLTQLSDGWKSKYLKVWDGILDLDIISQSIYAAGGQQDAIFNRKLVGNIIHYLSEKGAFSNYNATQFANLLEGNNDHPIRNYMYKNPSDDIVSRLDRFLETFEL